jgi:CheY-like chemotaxis protein
MKQTPFTLRTISDLKVLLTDDKIVDMQPIVTLLRTIVDELRIFSGGKAVLNHIMGDEESLRKAARNRERVFDVLITDLDMPELDGAQVIEELHAADHPGYLIAYTAHPTSNPLAVNFFNRINGKVHHICDISALADIDTMRKLLQAALEDLREKEKAHAEMVLQLREKWIHEPGDKEGAELMADLKEIIPNESVQLILDYQLAVLTDVDYQTQSAARVALRGARCFDSLYTSEERGYMVPGGTPFDVRDRNEPFVRHFIERTSVNAESTVYVAGGGVLMNALVFADVGAHTVSADSSKVANEKAAAFLNTYMNSHSEKERPITLRHVDFIEDLEAMRDRQETVTHIFQVSASHYFPPRELGYYFDLVREVAAGGFFGIAFKLKDSASAENRVLLTRSPFYIGVSKDGMIRSFPVDPHLIWNMLQTRGFELNEVFTGFVQGFERADQAEHFAFGIFKIPESV